VLLFLVGASGSGKTTHRLQLADRLRDLAVHDVDEPFADAPHPTELDRVWRAEQSEGWIGRALAYERDGVDMLLTGGVFGELLACPSAARLDGIAGCLLDCEENERKRRLMEREPAGSLADQLWRHLIWSAWLRLHRVDPQFFTGPIRGGAGENPDGVAPWLRWDRWERWRRGDPRWDFDRADTTMSTPEQTAERLVAWIEAERARHRAGALALSGRWWD
jgi:hypothetical protein